MRRLKTIGINSGLDVIGHLAGTKPYLPTVLLTGQVDHTIDVAAMRAGATDFLEKSRFDSQLLDRTIRYAIEQKRNERRLTALVERDDLTGLYNRAGLTEKLEGSIAIADRTDRLLGVLFLDMDRFKHVNDSLGHPVGDALLREVASRLISCCRSTDIIARMGGDEFAIIATHLQYRPARRDDDALRLALIRLAKQYGRYGYRKIAELLRIEGWKVNHKKVERIWREEGLQLPQRHKKRRRLYHKDASIIRLRPTHPNHVWSIDFVHDKLDSGRSYKMLTVLDE